MPRLVEDDDFDVTFPFVLDDFDTGIAPAKRAFVMEGAGQHAQIAGPATVMPWQDGGNFHRRSHLSFLQFPTQRQLLSLTYVNWLYC
jgi:hypothetical protein